MDDLKGLDEMVGGREGDCKIGSCGGGGIGGEVGCGL